MYVLDDFKENNTRNESTVCAFHLLNNYAIITQQLRNTAKLDPYGHHRVPSAISQVGEVG